MSEDRHHCTWPEVQRVLLYCDRVKAKLNLSHWDVAVAVDPAKDGCHASMDSSPGRYFATVYLAPGWEGKPKLVKRSTLLHEMLHLIHQQQEATLEDQILDKTDINEDRAQQIMHSYRMATEYMVDALTGALVRSPGFLPAWPTKSEAKHVRNGEWQ